MAAAAQDAEDITVAGEDFPEEPHINVTVNEATCQNMHRVHWRDSIGINRLKKMDDGF